MEAVVKEALGTKVLNNIKLNEGYMSDGMPYQTDQGIVMIKQHICNTAYDVYTSESETLKLLMKTKYFKVPEPLTVVKLPRRGAAIVTKYIEFKPLSQKVGEMGINLAKLHLHNIKLEEKCKRSDQFVGSSMEEISDNTYVPKFGFPITTYCGGNPQNNEWCNDWETFFGRKLDGHMMKLEKEDSDREVMELWSRLKLKLPEFFKGLDIKPSLLHGELWEEKCGETQDETVLFEPASFYGHHEYDLAMEEISGTDLFRCEFFDSYHSLIPKAHGFASRNKLYLLYHYVNNWLNFGCEYQESVIHVLKQLIKDPIY